MEGLGTLQGDPLVQCPWRGLLVMSHSHCPLGMAGHPAEILTLERKNCLLAFEGAFPPPRLSPFSSHESSKRLVWGGGRAGSQAKAWEAGWGMEPNPAWPGTPHQTKRSPRPAQSKDHTKGARSRGSWAVRDAARGGDLAKYKVAEPGRPDMPHQLGPGAEITGTQGPEKGRDARTQGRNLLGVSMGRAVEPQ